VDADYYHIKYQGTYINYPTVNPTNPLYDIDAYYLGPDSITQGFEGEVNAALGWGITFMPMARPVRPLTRAPEFRPTYT
jgi:hypothetical protein